MPVAGRKDLLKATNLQNDPGIPWYDSTCRRCRHHHVAQSAMWHMDDCGRWVPLPCDWRFLLCFALWDSTLPRSRRPQVLDPALPSRPSPATTPLPSSPRSVTGVRAAHRRWFRMPTMQEPRRSTSCGTHAGTGPKAVNRLSVSDSRGPLQGGPIEGRLCRRASSTKPYKFIPYVAQ